MIQSTRMERKAVFGFKQPYAICILFLMIFPAIAVTQDCKKVTISDFPVVDLPNKAERANLKQEKSYKYYYGIGTKIDYIKARQQAFVEIEKDTSETLIGGYDVLMMLYANGFGVERNLDLSIRIACANLWSAPAEREGRIQHLMDMKKGTSKGTFDICDDITSGLMDGICHGIQSELADVQRNVGTASITEKWTRSEKDAFDSLRKIADLFFDESSMYEVDQSGTSRAAFVSEQSDDLQDQFFGQIKKADQCSLEKYSNTDFNKADHALNAVYAKIKDNTIKVYGAVTKEGVRKTQRSWILYRDAWAWFGVIKCPESTEFWWKTMITKERTIQLHALVENQY